MNNWNTPQNMEGASVDAPEKMPAGAKQHPAVELEDAVKNIRSLDEQRAQLLEQREVAVQRINELIDKTRKHLEDAKIATEGIDVDSREEAEHFESARHREDERKSYGPL